MDNPNPDGIKGEPQIEDLLKRIKEKELKYFFGEVNKGWFWLKIININYLIDSCNIRKVLEMQQNFEENASQ